jgi:hypothetical protein
MNLIAIVWMVSSKVISQVNVVHACINAWTASNTHPIAYNAEEIVSWYLLVHARKDILMMAQATDARFAPISACPVLFLLRTARSASQAEASSLHVSAQLGSTMIAIPKRVRIVTTNASLAL